MPPGRVTIQKLTRDRLIAIPTKKCHCHDRDKTPVKYRYLQKDRKTSLAQRLQILGVQRDPQPSWTQVFYPRLELYLKTVYCEQENVKR